MGMFDNIVCKTALPIPKDRGELSNVNWMREVFQTKDLSCNVTRVDYEIREDGTLWANGKHCKEFDGSVAFHSFFMKEENDYWVEFIAFFDNGKLVKDVKRIAWTSDSNESRIKENERLTNHMKEMRVRYNSWRWKYLFLPWNRSIRWSTNFMRRIIDWNLRATDWIENKLTIM
ncbi:hypothetical protein H8E06_00220 [bacterium]|nr:hypothetical protein [bacterium]